MVAQRGLPRPPGGRSGAIWAACGGRKGRLGATTNSHPWQHDLRRRLFLAGATLGPGCARASPTNRRSRSVGGSSLKGCSPVRAAAGCAFGLTPGSTNLGSKSAANGRCCMAAAAYIRDSLHSAIRCCGRPPGRSKYWNNRPSSVRPATYSQRRTASGVQPAAYSQRRTASGVQPATYSQRRAASGVRPAAYSQRRTASGVQPAAYSQRFFNGHLMSPG